MNRSERYADGGEEGEEGGYLSPSPLFAAASRVSTATTPAPARRLPVAARRDFLTTTSAPHRTAPPASRHAKHIPRTTPSIGPRRTRTGGTGLFLLAPSGGRPPPTRCAVMAAITETVIDAPHPHPTPGPEKINSRYLARMYCCCSAGGRIEAVWWRWPEISSSVRSTRPGRVRDDERRFGERVFFRKWFRFRARPAGRNVKSVGIC